MCRTNSQERRRHVLVRSFTVETCGLNSTPTLPPENRPDGVELLRRCDGYAWARTAVEREERRSEGSEGSPNRKP